VSRRRAGIAERYRIPKVHHNEEENMRYRVYGLLGALAITACSGTTEVDQDAINLKMEVEGPQVRLVLENAGATTISSPCPGLFLEREGENGWELVWGPSCLQPVPPIRVDIPAGGSRKVEFAKPSVPGRYRAAGYYRLDPGTTDRVVRTDAVDW
jgi:hypothetical protein